jgi:DNA-binding response OmpR family regulator
VSTPAVLVAIADLFFLSKIKTALEAQGCTVRIATQAQPLLKEAVNLKPSLMILDLGLSTADPVLLIQELRRTHELNSLPVLCYTNHTQVQKWEEKLKDNMTKVVSNSYISSNINRIIYLTNQLFNPPPFPDVTPPQD